MTLSRRQIERNFIMCNFGWTCGTSMFTEGIICLLALLEDHVDERPAELFMESGKGQLNSELIYEVMISYLLQKHS